MRLHTILNYEQARYDFLRRVEGEPTDVLTGAVYAYSDRKSIPTIGIGINLDRINLDRNGVRSTFPGLAR